MNNRLVAGFVLMGLFTVASTGWADPIALTGGLYGNGSWMTNATAWADGQVPHDDADYIVDRNNIDKNNNAIRFGEATFAFGGKSLQFGVVNGFSPAMIFASTTTDFPRDGLKLARGSMTSWVNQGGSGSVRVHKIKGKVTVLAEGESNAYKISSGKDYHSYMIESNLVGSANAYLKVQSDLTGFQFPLCFDGSAYKGTITASGSKGIGFPIGSRFCLNGLFHVSAADSIFSFESGTVNAPIKDLSIAAPVTFQLYHAADFGTNIASAVLRATDSFSYTGSGKMLVKHSNAKAMEWKQQDAGRTYMRFLTVPKSAAITADDFQSTYVSTARQHHPVCDIVELEESPDTKTFALRRRPYLQYEGNSTSTADDPEIGPIFTWGGTSSDGIPLTDRRNWDFDFFTKAEDTARYYSTPNEDKVYERVGGYFYFTGKSNGSGGNAIGVLTKDVDVGIVYLEGGCYIANGGGAAANGGILRGDITLVDFYKAGTRFDFRFGTSNGDGRKMEIAATLRGECDTRVTSGTGAGVIRLSGDNSAYTGGWLLDGARGKSEFRITRPSALGGALAAFRADALILTNNVAFIPEGTMTLDEATRGITIRGTAAEIDVENTDRVTLGSRLTFDGTLVKGGSGTLVLSNDVDVTSGRAALTVAAGCVCPKTAEALSGVTLSCGPNGAFLYDIPAADATGVGATGLVDPILAEGSTFRMVVAIDERPDETLSVPVCALASDKVAAFKAAFKFVRATANTGCRLVEKSASDGRVTLVAEVYPSGLLMIVR